MSTKIETLFISDVHLGNKNSRADDLLKVFKKYEFKRLIIVGDLLDLTSLKKSYYWNKNHSTVIQKILKMSKGDVEVIYILGNHDWYFRGAIEEGGIYFGKILICDSYVYNSISGEKIFITHGDCFDGFVRLNPIMYWIGDNAYELTIQLNKIYNWFRRIFGLQYWSLSAYLKSRVKNAVKFLTEYKKFSSIKTIQMGCQSIMIGHTHHPEIIMGEYYNTGDFCESCSYIIEKLDGKIELRFVK